MRNYTVIDKCCIKSDFLLHCLTGKLSPANFQQLRQNPAEHVTESVLTPTEKKQVAGLMRVNYAGEVSAQALYQGQSLTAKNNRLKQVLEKAGLEEIDHLYWCQSRLNDLNSRVSILNPLWYTGAFLLGLVAGQCGDQWNLGFLQETEKQVVKHLNTHLEKLPTQDNKTRVILEKMHDEEEAHAQSAQTQGARNLPTLIRNMMALVSAIMTKTAYWI